MPHDRWNVLLNSRVGGPPARWLPAAAVEALVDVDPSVTSWLRAGNLQVAAQDALLANKVPGRLAQELYRTASPGAVARALAAGESRSSCLETALVRVRAGEGCQTAITGRRVTSNVAGQLVAGGLLAGPAERLLARSMGTVDHDDLVLVLGLYWSDLAAEKVAGALERLQGRASSFGAWICQQRADVRAVVVADPLGHPQGVAMVGACLLTADEQQQVADALEPHVRHSSGAAAGAAGLLDRVTTVAAVREQLWAAMESADVNRREPTHPDTWPVVTSVSDLSPVQVRQLLQRQASPAWGPGLRSLQWVELSTVVTERTGAEVLVDRLREDAAGWSSTSPTWWLVDEVAPAGHPWISGSVAQMVQRASERLADARAAARAAAEVDGVALRGGRHWSEAPEPQPQARHGDVALWRLDDGRAGSVPASEVAEHLAARLGDDRTRWALAWKLLPGFPGTCDELCDTVDVSVGA